MKIKLSPCPFCGGMNLLVVSNGIGDFFIACGDNEELAGCGARSCDYRCETEEHAAERWNRRV